MVLFSTVKIKMIIGVERKEMTFLLRGFICTLCRRKHHSILTADLHRFMVVVQVQEQDYCFSEVCGRMWELSGSIWDMIQRVWLKKCMLQESEILECNKWICKKIKLFRAVLSDLFQFFKICHEDTRIIECSIKATFIPDVTFSHSVLVYNMPKSHMIRPDRQRAVSEVCLGCLFTMQPCFFQSCLAIYSHRSDPVFGCIWRVPF